MRRDGKPLLLLLILFVSVVTMGMVVLFDQVEHLSVFVLFLVLLMLVVVPVLVNIFRGEFDLFEPIVPFGAMNFLFYGAGALFVLYVRGVAEDTSVVMYLDLAAAYCTLGYACSLVGYYFSGRFVPKHARLNVPRPGPFIIGVVYAIGYFGEVTFALVERAPMSLTRIVTGVGSLVTGLSFLATFAFFYACFVVMSRQSSHGFKSLLWSVMIPTQIIGAFLRFGNKTALFLAIGVPILAHWYARRKIAWKSLTVVVLISVFFVFPLYYTVRNYKASVYTQQERITRTFESMAKAESGAFAQEALRTVARRLAIINSTAVVIRDCGSRVDYAMGSTLWVGVVSAVVPRILWSGKPKINLGQEFGKIFHMTPFGNYSSISPSQAGELYWNFHIPGIVIGMFIIGVYMRTLYARFGANRGTDPVRLAIYVTLMYAFMQTVGDNIAGFESLLIKQTALLLILERLLIMIEGTETSPLAAAPQAAQAHTL